MTTLITGGTGKTGGRLAQLLQENNRPVIVASRSGTAPSLLKSVKFDWSNPDTFENPFNACHDIDKVYLIAPPIFDSLPVVKPFIDYAISKGVKRFIHGSSSAMDKGGITDGKIHEYLVDLGVDYTILRPTWFIENFGTFYLSGIRDNDEIPSVTEDGRVPFVGVADIAQAAYDAVVAPESWNKEVFVVGSQLFSYDEMADLLSELLGRRITHRRISHEESHTFWENLGLDSEYAAMLTTMEAKIADGYEEDIAKSTNVIVGKADVKEYLVSNKGLWSKPE